MSNLFIRALTTALLTAMVSCSAGKQAVQVGFDVRIEGAATTHPVMLFAQEVSTGKRISKTFPSGSTELALRLPNGAWKFSFIAWDGASPLEGVAKCFETTQTLDGGAVVVNAALAVTNCSASTFGGASYYDASNGLRRINLHHCIKNADVIDETSTCEEFERGFHRSFKISLLQMDETVGGTTSVGLESQCITAGGAIGEQATNLRLPYGIANGPFKFGFKGYESADCSGTPDTLINDHVLASSTVQVFSGGTDVEMFIESEGPIRGSRLSVDTGYGCDFGSRGLDPVKLSTASGEDLYVFESVKAGSQVHLFTVRDLNGATFDYALDPSVNPSSDEKALSLVKVGNFAFFNALAQNDYTYRLYKLNESGTTDLTPTITTIGTDGSNLSGVLGKLIVFGTRVYYSFKSTPAGSTELCYYDTLSTTTDCSQTHIDVALSSPFATSSTGVFYTGEHLLDSNRFKIFHVDANSGAQSAALDIGSSMTSLYSVQSYSNGGHDYLVLNGSPNSVLIYQTDTTMTEILSSVDFQHKAIPYGSEMIFKSGHVPIFVNGSTLNSIEALASETLNTGGGSLYTEFVGVSGEYFYFTSNRGDPSNQINLYAYSNVTNVITPLTTFVSGDNFWSIHSALLGSELFFVGSQGSNTVLYKVNGTTPTLVKIINPSAKNVVYQMVARAGKIFFAADDGVNGVEPWVSDGTAAGTTLFLDSSPGAGSGFPFFRGEVGDYFFFSAATKLYRSRGTPATTQIQLNLPGLDFMGSSLEFPDGFLFNLSSATYMERYNYVVTEQAP